MTVFSTIKGVVSKQTVVLHQWGLELINVNIDHCTGIVKADVSSVSPSSEQIKELWVGCGLYRGDGAALLVVTWQREKQEHII